MGDVVTLSGYSYSGPYVYLFLTGPNLPANGVALTNIYDRADQGGFTVVPIMAGPVVNPTRSETISGQYEYPVVAVKAMSAYQPKDYQFSLTDRTFFDKKSIPSTAPILNGDLGEDAARFAAEAFVKQLQSEAAHQKHHMVSNLNCQVQVSEGELLHTPIWYFRFAHRNENVTVLIDGHAGRVIRTMQ